MSQEEVEVMAMSSRRDFLQWLAATSASGVISPAASAGSFTQIDKGPAGPTGSDLGTIFPFVESQAMKGEFPLSFLSNEFTLADAWRFRAKTRLMDLLHYSPQKCDPKAEVVGRTERNGYVQEKVYFNTTPDIRVPAYVLVPKNMKKKAPGIVALHDHGGFYLWGKEKLVESDRENKTLTEFKQHYYAGKSIASELARMGYVVIVIDMFYWGERRMLLDDDPADWRDRPVDITADRIAAFNRRAGDSEQLVGRSIFTTGITWPGIIFWDDIRTVDYLASRPEVDSDRLGCVGLSVGGFRACHLTALDERIKAGVVVGWMASFPTQIKTKIKYTIGHTMLVPGLYRYLDYPDVACIALPRALMVINGAKDTLFDQKGVLSCFEKLNACYAKAKVSDKLKTRLYDTPHEFNAEMQAEAWEWLKRWV